MPERITMPLLTFRATRNTAYDHFPTNDGLPQGWKGGIRPGQYGESGCVRVHHPIRDFFRRYISFPEWNLLDNNGGPKTFNRGSLIDYLNTEIRHLPQGNGEEALRPLRKGWFGGLIGGTGDDRIRQVYAKVFNFYQEINQEALNKMAIERPIQAWNLRTAPLLIAEEEKSIVFLHHNTNACQKIFAEGSAKVTLNRCSHKENQDNCSLIIEIKDNLSINELMEWITGLSFTGTLNPIFIRELRIRCTPPANLEISPEEIRSRTEDLINAIQEWQASFNPLFQENT